MEVLIRYNNNFPKEKMWRLIVDGVEKLLDVIEIQCVSKTSLNEMPNGEKKGHIFCRAKEIVYYSEVGKPHELCATIY